MLWLLSGNLLADIPTDYYEEAIGKTNNSLKSALHKIIANHGVHKENETNNKDGDY